MYVCINMILLMSLKMFISCMPVNQRLATIKILVRAVTNLNKIVRISEVFFFFHIGKDVVTLSWHLISVTSYAGVENENYTTVF